MNERGMTQDRTYLSLDDAERRGFLHRDYLAHCLRWTHVVKLVAREKTQRILDIGCGIEQPLARMLYVNRLTSVLYLGVDLNPLTPHETFTTRSTWRPGLVGNTAFLDLPKERVEELLGGPPCMVTCLEMLEHVEPDEAYRICRRVRADWPDCLLVVSTPCFSAKEGAADNHVCEWRYEVLGWMLEMAGHRVRDVFGTFASWPDVKAAAYEFFGKDQVERLRQYYDPNVLSCMLAPPFPHLSRNAIWELVGPDTGQPIVFKIPPRIWPGRSGSSSDMSRWRQMCLDMVLTDEARHALIGE